MSFRGLRDSRGKKQARSFVTGLAPSGTASDATPGDLQPLPPEDLGFRHDLPESMKMKVVPSKGRAIFSTVSSKPGFAPIRHCISISGTNI